jgi:DNA-binding LacI/PurR family transcriptional regulator
MRVTIPAGMQSEKPGPRLGDVAREAGVSKSAASYVLNGRPGVSGATRTRVLEVAERIGYRHRGAGRGRPAGTLGAVLSPTRRHGETPNYFVAELLAGAEREARRLGYELSIGWWDPERGTEPRPGVRAVLFLGGAFEPDALARISTPAVVVGTTFPSLHLDAVLADNRRGLYLATTHLLDLGRRRLALLNGPARASTTSSKQLGFQDAFLERELAWEDRPMRRLAFSAEAGEEAALSLLRSSSPPDGIVAGDDVIAIGALHAAARLGIRVPEELAIVGFGDSPAASLLRPSLSSVHVFLQEMGSLGVRRLVHRLQEDPKEGPRVQSLVAPELVVRRSSGGSPP